MFISIDTPGHKANRQILKNLQISYYYFIKLLHTDPTQFQDWEINNILRNEVNQWRLGDGI